MNRPILTIPKKNMYGTMWKSRTILDQVSDQAKAQLKNDITVIVNEYSSNKTDNYNANVRLWKACVDQVFASIQNAHNLVKSVYIIPKKEKTADNMHASNHVKPVDNAPKMERTFEALLDEIFGNVKTTLAPDVLKLIETAFKDFKAQRGERPTQVTVHTGKGSA